MNKRLINKTAVYVQNELADAEGGHDWHHIKRVWINAQKIAENEDVDMEVVELAALLHDIADPKFHNGNEDIGPQTARNYLESTSLNEEKKDHVINIIKHMSFKNSLDEKTFGSNEMDVVQDADRLDAIGAIGIARAFNYGGFKNRIIFDSSIFPKINLTKEEYKNTSAPSINHFYEKLLLLKDKMNTTTGRKIAEKRHQFMLSFLEQFYEEVGVPNWIHS